jgi:hypothetical protein
MAMLVLFRLSTGDNWNGILKDAMLKAPDCDDSGDDCEKNCCANPVIAPLYFISFCLVSTFVMLNLVIAVLMAELESAEDEAVDFDDEIKEEENVLATKTDKEIPVESAHDPEVPAPDVAAVSQKAQEPPRRKESGQGQGVSKVENRVESEEETTETLEQQVHEALQPESDADVAKEKSVQAKKQIETLEAELAAALAQQERSESPQGAPALPPLPLHSAPRVSSNPTTPGRPSSFVPFAPALVVDDDQEDIPNPNACQQPGSAGR